jgi:hypothetical protein
MNKTLNFLLLGAALFSAAVLQAQIDPPPPGGGVPIDGASGALIAAGVLYGAKKLRDARKKDGSGQNPNAGN